MNRPSTVTEILLTKINQRNEKIALLALEVKSILQ